MDKFFRPPREGGARFWYRPARIPCMHAHLDGCRPTRFLTLRERMAHYWSFITTVGSDPRPQRRCADLTKSPRPPGLRPRLAPCACLLAFFPHPRSSLSCGIYMRTRLGDSLIVHTACYTYTHDTTPHIFLAMAPLVLLRVGCPKCDPGRPCPSWLQRSWGGRRAMGDRAPAHHHRQHHHLVVNFW